MNKLLFSAFMVLFVAGTSSAIDLNRGISGALDAYRQQLWQQMQQKKQIELEAQRQRREEESRQRQEAREREEERNSTYTGTGFFVNSNGYIVTNAHVVSDREYVAIRDLKGRFFHAKIVSKDKANDFALLKIGGTFPSLRILHSDNVTKGQRVLTVGYPQVSIQGNESKVTDGIINSLSGLQGDDKWFQISVPIQGGNSGGPLVNENGDIVGVIVASLNDKKMFSKTGSMPQNVNYAIKSKVLLDFLSSQKVSNTPQKKAPNSIDSVDRSTVLVISKNIPIDVTYEDKPPAIKDDTELTERNPNWKAITQSANFKNWLKDNPSEKRLFDSQSTTDKEKVFEAYNNYLKTSKDAKDRSLAEKEQLKNELEASKQLKLRDERVAKTQPDWLSIKDDPNFLDWLATQPESTRNVINSLDVKGIVNVVKVYKESPPRKLKEIGKVKSLFQQYGYLVFTLNDIGYKKTDEVIFLVSGKKVKGQTEKRNGEDVSVLLDKANVELIKNGDIVYVY